LHKVHEMKALGRYCIGPFACFNSKVTDRISTKLGTVDVR